jgi:hypothetical protein
MEEAPGLYAAPERCGIPVSETKTLAGIAGAPSIWIKVDAYGSLALALSSCLAP